MPADALDWSGHEVRTVLYGEFSSVDERTVAHDKWLDEAQRHTLFSEFLASDGAVYRFWSVIASKLDLPLVTSIYMHGLQLETAGQLAKLEHELSVLEAYWDSHPDEIHEETRERLAEQTGYLREAIRIAKENGATLGIS
jgi:hypothetical protein